MKQATPNIRTIDHADHTDIERLFYVYSPDGSGGVTKSTVWAVVWCGLKQEKQAMKFLGTRVIGIDIDSQYIVADVVSDGAVLPHSVNVNEYITNLLKQIDALKAEVKNLDEGAKMLYTLATKGEEKLLQDWQLNAIAEEADYNDLKETERSQLP